MEVYLQETAILSLIIVVVILGAFEVFIIALIFSSLDYDAPGNENEAVSLRIVDLKPEVEYREFDLYED